MKEIFPLKFGTMNDVEINALVALISASLAAWVTSSLTTKRERWNLRRELYTELLKGLDEAKETLQLIVLVEVTDSEHVGISEPAVEANRRKEKKKELGIQLAKALQHVRETASVAQILLDRKVIFALDKLKQEQKNSLPSISYFLFFDHQLRALIRSQRLVVDAARRELGLRRFTDGWLWSDFRQALDPIWRTEIGSDWESIVRERWGSAVQWVKGNGPFALVAVCQTLTVTLWESEDEAKSEKQVINRTGCGSRCNWTLHSIIDLRDE